ncbi:MAG: ATP-grasp domain-containing protein [Arenicella sp.]
MHWVIQKNLFKPVNYRLLIEALDRLEIKYSTVFIPNGTLDLEPEVNIIGNVYICGAIKLKKISQTRNWFPGSFLNNNFSFDKWLIELGDKLLNSDAVYGRFDSVQIENMKSFFIRPMEDNKAFDGMVVDSEMLSLWRADSSKEHLMNLEVIVSPVKDIYREYRMFVVKKKVITGSVYKVSGKPEVSGTIEKEAINYVYGIINKWVPCESFVIDICLTANGYRVIEFNNINSSGFYDSNVLKYVEAIQQAYSK